MSGPRYPTCWISRTVHRTALLCNQFFGRRSDFFKSKCRRLYKTHKIFMAAITSIVYGKRSPRDAALKQLWPGFFPKEFRKIIIIDIKNNCFSWVCDTGYSNGIINRGCKPHLFGLCKPRGPIVRWTVPSCEHHFRKSGAIWRWTFSLRSILSYIYIYRQLHCESKKGPLHFCSYLSQILTDFQIFSALN
jgi:hypothetical protein